MSPAPLRCAHCGEPGALEYVGLDAPLCPGCRATVNATRFRCWRCGCGDARRWSPYALCDPCLDVVSPEEIDWLGSTDGPTYALTPLGRPCGGEEGDGGC